MNKFTLFFVACFFCVCSFFCAHGKIVQLDAIALFEQEAGSLDTESLVLFDIDDTLITPTDAVLTARARSFAHKLIAEILYNPAIVPPDKYPDGFLYGRVLLASCVEAVEEDSAAVVQQLQNRQIPVLALTAAEERPLGEIKSFGTFRIKQLKELGFDFSHTLPNVSAFVFSKNCQKPFYPIFKAGIIFAANHPKGEILKEFLQYIRLAPTKVVFFDDKMENLLSVEKAMDEMGIEYIGFHYTAAQNLPYVLDEKMAELQFRYLAEHGIWLSDAQARKQFFP